MSFYKFCKLNNILTYKFSGKLSVQSIISLMNKYNNFSNIVQTDEDLDVEFQAYQTSLEDFSKEDIVRILSENDDEKKIVAIINLKSIDNKFETDLILSHLTGQNGRIREAVSYILSELNPSKFCLDEKSKEIIVKGILDINPNVVRNVLTFIDENQILKNKLIEPVIKKTNEVLADLSRFIREDSPFFENTSKSNKNHAKNKLTFNLYWLLETISILDVNKIENLEEILTKTSNFLDYTIREKTAKILSKMENKPPKLLRKLKNDENIYVKNQLLC